MYLLTTNTNYDYKVNHRPYIESIFFFAMKKINDPI